MNITKLEGWILSAKPDAIIAEIRRRIRQALGDEVENKTMITASHGYYRISFKTSVPDALDVWNNLSFRRGAVKQLAKDLRAAKRKR